MSIIATVTISKLSQEKPSNGERCLMRPDGLYWRECVWYKEGVGKRGEGFYNPHDGRDKVYLGKNEQYWMPLIIPELLI